MRFTHQQGMRMPPQYVNALALVANTHERQAIPSGYQYVVINSTANIYCRLGDETVVASVPGDVNGNISTATTATTVHGFTTIVER